MIKSTYINLIQEYGVELSSSETLWKEIRTNYSQRKRYYHNIEHLEDLLDQLTSVKQEIKKWNVILFTLFYHDIVYKSTKKDNEEQSAILASNRMNEIGVSKKDIKHSYAQIIATKSHKENIDPDTNYFTDADLSILGRAPKVYQNYCHKIREEYSIYPKFLYNKGRKKVINHFLSMNRIFKTQEFYNKFEEQAKHNLNQELKML